MSEHPRRPAEDRPRVFVTGLGAVTPFGWTTADLARGLDEGRHAIDGLRVLRPDGHTTRIAGQVPETTSVPNDLLPFEWARLSRTDRFALAAAREALDQARLAPAPGVAGVYLGSSTGGMLEGEAFFDDLEQDRRRLRLSRLSSFMNNGPSDLVNRVFRLGGPVVTLASACAAAGLAIEAALQDLRAGTVEVALAGGADALCQLTYSGFNSLRAVDTEPCRPFRGDRAGLSLGEGAGILVLESEAHARARGAPLLAELIGAGSSCDAFHMTAPEPEGAGVLRAIEKALADAGLDSEAVSLVNAHGTGTPHNDAAEARALRRLFGARTPEVVVAANKGAIGHLLGACGGVEAVATILALANRRVGPTPGAGAIDPECAIELALGGSRSLPRDAVGLSINLAFGGANAALLFRAPEDA